MLRRIKCCTGQVLAEMLGCHAVWAWGLGQGLQGARAGGSGLGGKQPAVWRALSQICKLMNGSKKAAGASTILVW